MQMQRTIAARAPQIGFACLLGVLIALPAAAAGLNVSTLHIESDPPDAEVLLIGGSAGRTPLTVGERALYPNDYPDERKHLYGIVTLRRAGCETYVHRVTRGDLERGLQVTLDCGTQATAPVPGARAAPAIQPERAAPPTLTPQGSSAPPAPPAGESVSQRRLRQLQVLQELLDEGLIAPAEERRIRRKLLETP